MQTKKKGVIAAIIILTISIFTISTMEFNQEENSIDNVDTNKKDIAKVQPTQVAQPSSTKQQVPEKKISKAVIIDQLDETIPNKYFQQKAKEYLNSANYEVDIVTTKDLTLDFFKKLPTMNYEFIVFRTHGLESIREENSTFLFTGERYQLGKYQLEQLSGQVARGIPLFQQELNQQANDPKEIDELSYFTFGSKLVDELMTGKFPDSIILVGGCESVRNKDLATSLIYRGASDVIGWDRTIGSIENDKVMLDFLERVLVNGAEINDAVISINEDYSSQLERNSQLHHIRRAFS